jgi:ADP-heptose:LPS heptosyltransferase
MSTEPTPAAVSFVKQRSANDNTDIMPHSDPAKRTFLVIQTAFIGDVVLATAIVESLHRSFPDALIDMLVRKGNEPLLANNPCLRSVLVWDKKVGKIGHLLALLGRIRAARYSDVINVHRYASSGLLTAFSGAGERTGFDKNPFSMFFTRRVTHEIGNGKHETERNQQLIGYLAGTTLSKPKLYPSARDSEAVRKYQEHPYICIAPGSVWFTKTFPMEQWVAFIRLYASKVAGTLIYLIGSASEKRLCDRILSDCPGLPVESLAGQLSFLESAALMRDALMSYVNDSAPLHIASAVNANVTAVYCSTVPAFGFGPLSDNSVIVEPPTALECRPCGLHGLRACPKGHFNCARTIDIQQLL